MRYLGIDPGLSGAAAVIETTTRYRVPSLIDVIDLPLVDPKDDREIDVAKFSDWVLRMNPVRAFIERGFVMPAQSAMSGFYYGETHGLLKAAVILAGVELIRIQPARWKKFYALQGVAKVGAKEAKGTARVMAMERFPEHRDLFKRVKDDGRAEAALIALWGAANHALEPREPAKASLPLFAG